MDVCPNCGERVDEATQERCPACNAPLQVTCPNCGASSPEGDDVCARCGASLAHATESL
jgi:predicted amidophosphoribosyltransferase